MAQQQSQQSGDDSMAPVWLTLLLFFMLFIIWYTAHEWIVHAIFTVTLFQAKLVALVLGPHTLADEISFMQTIDPAAVDWDLLMDTMGRVGAYTRYPLSLCVVLAAIVLYRSDVTAKYHRVHDMKSLRAQEQANWPCIMPVVKQDLAKVDINSGPWSMALSPLEFSRKFNLLRKEDPLLDGVKKQDEMTAAIRHVDAKRIFTLQLGPLWEGFEACSLPARALAAVFMARINRDRQAASMILDALDKSTVAGKPDYTVAFTTLKKYQNTPLVQEIVQGHAYVLTVMASLLHASRDDGVVPSAEFLWLKPIDRRLWYMLNCVGRQTPFVEVGGPFAHWRAEQVMGCSALTPMVDEAIKALEIAVKEVKLSTKELMELKP
jgi:intracellular multiplication protein IcmP